MGQIRVTIEQTWIEAAETFPPASRSMPGSWWFAQGHVFRSGRSRSIPPDSPWGAPPRAPIPTGVPIFASMLVAPREVERGDKVKVEVTSGERCSCSKR